MTETRYEVWNSYNEHFRGPQTFYLTFAEAARYVQWHRKRIRVRTFYDRRLKWRIVQILAGTGFGAR